MTALRQVVKVFRAEGFAGVVQRTARRAFLAAVGRAADLVIVQVGAFVGATGNDPLYRFLQRHFDPDLPTFLPSARAILIEPDPSHFAKLRANYSSLRNITFENVAIDAREGTLPFFRLSRDPKLDGFPEWLEQLGSLREDRMTTLFATVERDPAAQAWYLEHRQVIEVPTVSLASLLERHGVTEVDLLQIDTEGSDYRVLSSLDFSRVSPRFINYERMLLGPEEAACRAMMRNAGYRLCNWGQDTFCWLTERRPPS